jgi:hypothetical protein
VDSVFALVGDVLADLQTCLLLGYEVGWRWLLLEAGDGSRPVRLRARALFSFLMLIPEGLRFQALEALSEPVFRDTAVGRSLVALRRELRPMIEARSQLLSCPGAEELRRSAAGRPCRFMLGGFEEVGPTPMDALGQIITGSGPRRVQESGAFDRVMAGWADAVSLLLSMAEG